MKPGDVVRAEEDDGLVMFYSADDGRLIYKCSKSMDGKIVICEQEREKVDSVGMTSFKRIFSQYSCYEEFMAEFEKVPLRYRNPHGSRMCMISKTYSEEKTVEAMEYCIKVKRCDAIEVVAYLMASYGAD